METALCVLLSTTVHRGSARGCPKGLYAPGAEALHPLEVTSFPGNLVALPLEDTLPAVAAGDSCPPDMGADGDRA